jgi:hypothetical protein
LGIGTDAFWVDAAPFNVGIITALSNVSFSPGSAVAHQCFLLVIIKLDSSLLGQDSLLLSLLGHQFSNVNASGIRVTGIVTITMHRFYDW